MSYVVNMNRRGSKRYNGNKNYNFVHNVGLSHFKKMVLVDYCSFKKTSNIDTAPTKEYFSAKIAAVLSIFNNLWCHLTKVVLVELLWIN